MVSQLKYRLSHLQTKVDGVTTKIQNTVSQLEEQTITDLMSFVKCLYKLSVIEINK